MKSIIVVCILLIAGRSYSQDILYQNTLREIVKEFSENSVRLTSYKKLPGFIKDYLDRTTHEKFRISKKRVNTTDAGGGPKRMLAYAAKLGDNYILGYEHGGRGYHFHSLIFQTNGKEVIYLYPVATAMKLNNITELIKAIETENWRFYSNDF